MSASDAAGEATAPEPPGPGRRLPMGQILLNQLRLFREALHAGLVQAGFTDIRPAHLHVFGNIRGAGSRPSDLAQRTNIGRSSMAELIDDLEAKGYVARVPDPSDGRARLVQLTDRGWDAVRAARDVIAGIEAGYGDLVGGERLEAALGTLEALIGELDPAIVTGYYEPPAR